MINVKYLCNDVGVCISDHHIHPSDRLQNSRSIFRLCSNREIFSLQIVMTAWSGSHITLQYHSLKLSTHRECSQNIPIYSLITNSISRNWCFSWFYDNLRWLISWVHSPTELDNWGPVEGFLAWVGVFEPSQELRVLEDQLSAGEQVDTSYLLQGEKITTNVVMVSLLTHCACWEGEKGTV